MYHSRSDFIRGVKKAAANTEDNEDQTMKGKQSSDIPRMLQPDEGEGTGSRGEEATFSRAAEKANDNRQDGHLREAFDEFDSASKEKEDDLKDALDSFDKDATVSKAQEKLGQSGEIRWGAFANELKKILDRQ